MTGRAEQHEETASFGVSARNGYEADEAGELRATRVGAAGGDLAIDQDQRQAIVAVLAEGGGHRRVRRERLRLLGEVEPFDRTP